MVTHHKGVLCNPSRTRAGLAPCTQEEADTRVILHVSDAVMHGHDSHG